MATSPVAKTFDLSTNERELVVRALGTHRASVSRAYNAEHDPDVKKIREANLTEIDALVLRFR